MQRAVDKRQVQAETLRDVLPPSSPLLKELDRLARAHLGGSSRVEDDLDDVDSMGESDAVSVALSAVSAFDADDVVPIDSERYARICSKMERLQSAVTKRDVKVCETKAKLHKQRRCTQSMRSELVSLRLQVQSLSSQVSRESAAKAEAVDKAAAALLAGERLQREIEQLREREQLVADQLKAQHASSMQIGDLHLKSSEEVRGLRAQLSALTREKRELEVACRGIQADLDDQKHRVRELGQRHAVLEEQVVQLKEINDQYDRQFEVQRERLARAEEDRRGLQDSLTAEQEESKHHAAHLLQTIIKLEDDLTRVRLQYRLGQEELIEAREANSMLHEELRHSYLWVESEKRTTASQQEQLQVAKREYHELVKECRDLDASRRRILTVFTPTRRHLSSIDAAMSQLCLELQRVSKTVAVGRYREAALGQALREYGKRNRELQTSLGTAKQKLRVVAGALHSSEKRKSVAVASSSTLKRDLVVEKCQRSELLQQCQELAMCLDRCQGVASETQARADSLHAENDSLQLVVQQLVAYAQALAQSQRSLQQELKHLEVVGRREPAVFG